MGIDKPDVRYVIHYDIPEKRRGLLSGDGPSRPRRRRRRLPGLLQLKDIHKLEKFMQGKPISEQEIGKPLLLDTVSYAESPCAAGRCCWTTSARTIWPATCSMCDNCVNPKPTFDRHKEIVW